MPRVVVLVVFALAASATSAGAQASQRARLAEFQGVYAYHGGTTLAIVAADTVAFAVIDEAKYPLRVLGGDRFLNANGDTIPFRRGADGVISGFVEQGTFFARRTTTVDAMTAAAVRAVPRQLGADGRSVSYVYQAPVDRGDGLRVGNATDAGLDLATVTRLVNRVIDGTYPDVHGILVYRGGKLVVEEYFYGYDRDRLHQMRSASKSVVSALVGIAIDRGALSGDSDRVTRHLPYASFANPDPRKDRLTLRDLLTMRSGLACDDWNAASPGNESRVYQANDWVKYVLDVRPSAFVPATCAGTLRSPRRMQRHSRSSICDRATC